MSERFTDELRALAGEKWDAVIKHKFTDELAAGTIDDKVLLDDKQKLVFRRGLLSVCRTTDAGIDDEDATDAQLERRSWFETQRSPRLPFWHSTFTAKLASH